MFLNDETTPIYTSPSSTIGALEDYTANVTSGGMNTFTVIGANSLGPGLPVSVEVFVGVDVAVISTDIPEWIILNDTITPTITVANIGAGAQSFSVSLTEGIYNETIAVTDLVSGAFLDIVFPDIIIETAGNYSFVITASDPGGDVNLANNTVYQNILLVDGCEHELALSDSWGDGWNGNAISVTVNGTEALDHVTMETGSAISHSFFADDGDTIVAEFFAQGGWPEECSWVIYDIAGDEVLAGYGPDSIVQTGFGLCTPPVIDLEAVEVSPYGDIFIDEYIIPSITIFNNGIETVDSFVVEITANDGISIVYSSAKSIDTPILPDQTITIDMDDYWYAAGGGYLVTGTVIAVGDEVPLNNSCTVELFVWHNTLFNISTAINTTANMFASFSNYDGTLTEICSFSTDPFPMAAEFDGNWMYVVYNDFNFNKVDGDGTVTPQGTITGATGTPTGLAYNHDNETMYLLTLEESNIANLYILNGLSASYVGSGNDKAIIAMDFANDGMLYGPAIADDQLYQINPTDASCVAIGPTGVDLNYGQDVSWLEGALYTFTSGDLNAFGVYNIENGEFLQIGSAISDQITAVNAGSYFGIANYSVVYGVYGEPEGSIEAFANGVPFYSGYELPIMSEIEFQASPNNGWSIANWWINGEPTGEISQILALKPLHGNIEALVEFTNSVDENNLKENRIYPNPTNGLLNIEILNPAKLEIINTTGNIVYEENIENNSTINLSSQLPGVYFVKLVSNSETFMKKVILK